MTRSGNRNDLEEPDFKRRRTTDGYVSIDHRKDKDILRNGIDDSVRYYGVRIYRNEDDVMRRFREGHPISGIMMELINRLVWVPYSMGQKDVNCVLFTWLQPEMSDSIGGLHFAKFKQYTNSIVQTVFQKRDVREEKKFCLMLPSTFRGNDFDSKFALIHSEWRAMNKDGDLGRWRV